MSISRRTFVKGSLASLPVVTAVSTAGCGNDVSPAPIVDVTVNDTPGDARYGQIEVAVPRYPDLAAVGGAVMLRIAELAPGSRPFVVPDRGVLLVHRGQPGDDNEFIATRADCPHQGCPLGYSAKDGLIECPCHGSRFLANNSDNDRSLCIGLVVHPPALDNLTVYGVKQLGDFVYVDLNIDQSCGTSADLPPVVNGTVTVPIAMYPSLQNVGGSIVGKPMGLTDKVIVSRVAADQIVCVAVTCTHRGCAVSLDIKGGDFECPCHGSRFGYDGAVLQDPATVPLKSYPVSFDGTVAVITAS